MLELAVEFDGGLELLFGNQKQHTLQIDRSDDTISMRELIDYLRQNLLQERPELFVQDDSVCPGILVLINDADWELEGGLDATVNTGDTVVFISTLHGG
ncbi:MAG: hypothetical protein MHM6MM_007042 [Cercozoa sp. M6MM]